MDDKDRRFLLDVSKFHLDAFKAETDAQIELMEAYAEFNLKMQEVIAKQIKNAQEVTKLQWMRLQLSEYTKALAANKSELAKIQSARLSLEESIRRAAMLALGEILSPDLVTAAWTGFFRLLSLSNFDSKLALSRLKISASERKGNQFVRPRTPDKPCEDAPTTTNNVLLLFDWARSKSLVPRSSSRAQEKLEQAMQVLNSEAAKNLELVQTQVVQARADLAQIRSILWKDVPIKALAPKVSSSRTSSSKTTSRSKAKAAE